MKKVMFPLIALVLGCTEQRENPLSISILRDEFIIVEHRVPSLKAYLDENNVVKGRRVNLIVSNPDDEKVDKTAKLIKNAGAVDVLIVSVTIE